MATFAMPEPQTLKDTFRIHAPADLYFNKIGEAPYITFEFEGLRISFSPLGSQSVLLWILPQLDPEGAFEELYRQARILEIPAHLELGLPAVENHVRINGSILGVPTTFDMPFSLDSDDADNLSGLRVIDKGQIILGEHANAKFSIEKAFYVYESAFFFELMTNNLFSSMDAEFEDFLKRPHNHGRPHERSVHPLFDTLHLIQAKIRFSFLDELHASLNMQKEIIRRFEADNRSTLWTLKVFYPELSYLSEDEVWQRIKDAPSKLNHDIANFLLADLPKAFFTYLFYRSDVTSDQRLHLDRLHRQLITHQTTLPPNPSCSKK